MALSERGLVRFLLDFVPCDEEEIEAGGEFLEFFQKEVK